TGTAVVRNQFRRRVRMAFLAVLRETPALSSAKFVLWVRPALKNSKGCRIEYRDIEKQIKLSLSSLRHV
ncbi:MAG: ribonuclease P protein component, partial [Holophagales bacterium]|nr:ribonuclease P protein component [Holophagales bacterium]